MVSIFEQIDYVKYDMYLFFSLILVLTRKAVLFALDLSLGFASLTSSLGSSANKISYFVRTCLNWNKQIRIITISTHFELLTQKFARQDFWPLKVVRLSKIGNPCISQMGSMVYILVQLLLKLTRKNILITLKDAKLTLILGLHNL